GRQETAQSKCVAFLLGESSAFIQQRIAQERDAAGGFASIESLGCSRVFIAFISRKARRAWHVFPRVLS
ncbi:MAG: hypothetical protein WAN42_17065, partial [Pseudolabrys sp.]